jgi:hypothetical protein
LFRIRDKTRAHYSRVQSSIIVRVRFARLFAVPFSFVLPHFRALAGLTLVVLLFCITPPVAASTLTWTGAGGDKNVSNPSNWSPNVAPTGSSDLVIDTSNDAIVWDTSASNVTSLQLNSGFGGTLTLARTLSASGSISINAGTVLTGQGTFTVINAGLDLNIGPNGRIILRQSSTAGNGAGQTITVGSNFTLASGGKIDTDGQGFATGSGPGAGTTQTNDGSGGAHGRRGGDSLVASGGTPYGSASSPVELGSGGAPGKSANGGIGGGAIKIQVGVQSSIDGLITANGSASAAGNLGGGGAGGSIWLITDSFSGSGTLRANGGASDGASNGGGGGGRIAISWNSTTFSGTVNAAPGAGSGGRVAEPGTYVFPDGYDLAVNASLALIPGTHNIPHLTISNTATLLLHADASVLPNGSGVTINSSDIAIAAGAAISATGQGFPTNAGPGAGANQACDGSGGGHGGIGGNSALDTGGNSYGSAVAPTALGSGGGAGCPGGSNGTGAGGGAIKLIASNSITIDGAIRANGESAVAGTSGGGGAAGSVWIVASAVSGAGQISANGGNSDGSTNGGGAGGRIAITPPSPAPFAYAFSGAISADPGSGGTTSATAGTIYIPPVFSSAADQNFPGNGPATAMQPITIAARQYANAAISAANGIRLKIPSTFNMIWDSSNTTATLSGPAAGKVATAVSYANSQTVVLTATSDFSGGDSITVSGLTFMNFSGGSAPNPDNLQLEVLNDGNTQALDTHTIRIQDVTAFDDSYSVITGSTLTVSAPGVLLNDTEISAKPLTAIIATTPAHGLLTLNPDGSFIYTPTAHFIGNDSFTYVANNGTTSSLPATVTIAVGKATLTVTASALSTTYGSPLPVFGYSFSGFVNGDSATAASGAPAFATPATAASPAGTYSIVPSLGTLASNFYTFTFVTSTLSVNKATLNVTAGDITKLYGAPVPALPFNYSGFRNGDTSAVISGAPALSTTASASSLEGSYPITITQGTLAAANYNFTFFGGTLKIVGSAPVIGSVLLSPNPASSGQTVDGSVDVSTTSGVSTTIVWDYGDGTTGTGATVQHAWAQQGIFTVTVTATGSDGVATSAQLPILISLTAGDVSAGGGDGQGGILIGADGPSSKLGKASVKIDFTHRDKTSLTCTINALNFPKGTNLSDFQQLPGILTFGSGSNQQIYEFFLDKNGRGKATSIPKISISTKKGSIAFTVNGRPGLTDLLESLGATYMPGLKSGPVIPISLRGTLSIGNKLFLAMTLKLNYRQKNTSGTATTGK